MMEIKPIRTENDYRTMLARVREIWNAEPETPASDELEILLPLVEAYEDEHYPIDPPDPIEAIKLRMEDLRLTRNDLEPCIGSRSRVSEVLNRKRPLSLDMIPKLSTLLGLPAEALAKPYPLEPSNRSEHESRESALV
jgi:HTH-type transcriptional regulator/antitoxin HigA